MCNGSGHLTADGRAPAIYTVEEFESHIAAERVIEAAAAVSVPRQKLYLRQSQFQRRMFPLRSRHLRWMWNCGNSWTNRWNECVGCIGHNLPLAATVMMGALLEGLILIRIKGLANKASVFTDICEFDTPVWPTSIL